jgi:hypothetical protein
MILLLKEYKVVMMEILLMAMDAAKIARFNNTISAIIL